MLAWLSWNNMVCCPSATMFWERICYFRHWDPAAAWWVDFLIFLCKYLIYHSQFPSHQGTHCPLIPRVSVLPSNQTSFQSSCSTPASHSNVAPCVLVQHLSKPLASHAHMVMSEHHHSSGHSLVASAMKAQNATFYSVSYEFLLTASIQFSILQWWNDNPWVYTHCPNFQQKNFPITLHNLQKSLQFHIRVDGITSRTGRSVPKRGAPQLPTAGRKPNKWIPSPNEIDDMLSLSALYRGRRPKGSHSPNIWCWAPTCATREVT